MKLAIIGSRGFTDYTKMSALMKQFLGAAKIEEVISGGATGADSLGARWAQDQGIQLTVFRPDWEKFGKSAGFIRNADIIKSSDAVVCFWDGQSRGTRHSMKLAHEQRKPIFIFYV